jgi:arylsulfatase A-like enzyme
MATRKGIGRRVFLQSAALGAASLAVPGPGCARRPSTGQLAPDAGGRPDASVGQDVGAQPDVGGQLDSGGQTDAGDVSDASFAPDGEISSDGRLGEEPAVDTGAVEEVGRSSPPNLLFILADQWRGQALGHAGDPNARTPVLDRLANESVTFTHAVSCVPVCCPYRATLMTGRYPTDTGIFLNDLNLAQDPLAFAARFKQAGYDTGYMGKWHLDGQGCRLDYTPPERRQGFVRWAAMECTHDYNHSLYYAGDNGVDRLTWPGYDAIAQTREMQRWLTERDPSTPFFYFLSWGPPHDPYNAAPAEFADRFRPEAIQVRPNVPLARADEARASLAGYYAHIAALDSCVAELLGTLDALGIADNTIVVFTSDHGDMHLSQGQGAKQQPWDESILVPFLLRYPAALGRSSRTVPMCINTPDIMPTLVGLAGLPTSQGRVQGRDLSPVLREESPPSDDPALIMCVSPFAVWNRGLGGKEYRGVRTNRFSFVRDLAGPWLLYDNLADPYQMTNLVGLSEYAAVQAELDSKLADQLAAIRDPFQDGGWYIDRWGYVVDPNDGAIPYSC